MSGDETTPSQRVLARASDANRHAGHENLGFLSVAHGLMPTAEPTLHLPGTHRAWDDLAGELPELYGRLAVRRAIDALPTLPADRGALADEHLLRAGALLGILAHAYWWADREPPSALPEAVATPWRTVSHRLGRPAPHLSYVDLVVYNWRLVDPARPRQVQNMRLLLPTVGNEAEHVFYLTQAEILARCAPVIDAVVRAHGAVRADAADVLIEALETIEACLDEVIRHALPKINPARWSPTHVDPVLWAKTVAPFGVPFYPSAAGPSGTSSPIFHVLDAFFGRATYRTRLGQEMTHLNQWHPRHWRDFVDAIRQTSVRSYVEARGHPPLRVAYDDALARYAGESGFLGRHRMKVYGYLELAFKVGRTVTIGGFSGPFRTRTWMDVDTELAHAADERRARPAADPSTDSAADARPASTVDVPRLPRSAVALHNNDRVGYWIAVDGMVYDVTRLRQVHPGGIDILDAHAGTDATAAFHRVGHHGSHRVKALAERYRIGMLDPEPAPDSRRPRGVPVLDRRDLPRGRNGERTAHRPRAAIAGGQRHAAQPATPVGDPRTLPVQLPRRGDRRDHRRAVAADPRRGSADRRPGMDAQTDGPDPAQPRLPRRCRGGRRPGCRRQGARVRDRAGGQADSAADRSPLPFARACRLRSAGRRETAPASGRSASGAWRRP